MYACEMHAYLIGHTSHGRTSLDRLAATIWHTSHRRASLTGVQLSQGMHISGFQNLALMAKLTQTVAMALRRVQCNVPDRASDVWALLKWIFYDCIWAQCNMLDKASDVWGWYKSL
jgi:hypothetical protein